MSFKQHAKDSTTIVWYSALALAILIAASFIVLYFKPAFLGFERKAFKESLQYVEAKQGMLLQMVDEYNDAKTEKVKYQTAQDNDQGDYAMVIESLEMQQSSLTTRIKNEAQLIKPKDVPDSVQRFINTH